MVQDSEMLLASVVEQIRLDIDILKHLTTLSTGAIVLLATFMDKLTPAKNARIAVPFAVVCFLLCIMYSVKLMMLTWAGNSLILKFKSILVQPDSDDRKKKTENVLIELKGLPLPSKVAIQIVQYSFALGIVSVGIFVVCNLW